MTVPQPPVDPVKALADLTTYATWSGTTIVGLSSRNDELTTQVSNLVGENDALRSANTSLTTENAKLVADNARLVRDLAECLGVPEPPDPPVVTSIFGASKNDTVPGNTSVAIGRVYYGGQISNTWKQGNCQDYVNAADLAIWASFKDDPGAALESFIRSLSDAPLAGFAWPGKAKVKLILSVNHEPENDNLDVALYNRRYDALMAIARKYDYVIAGPIRMNSQPQAANDRYWPTAQVDFDGWDCYNPGIQTPKAYVAPSTVYSKPVASAKAKGLRLMIAETGTGKISSDTSGAGRQKWAKDAHAELARQNAGCGLWWNSAGCAFGDAATADAWLKG